VGFVVCGASGILTACIVNSLALQIPNHKPQIPRQVYLTLLKQAIDFGENTNLI
jgi:hypothetical protein